MADKRTPYEVLAESDEVLRGLVDTYGQVDPFRWAVDEHSAGSRFSALLLHVVSQQISTKVALTIFARIEEDAGHPPAPEEIVSLGVAGLRACGLSRAKGASLVDISTRVLDGSLDLDRLDTDSDEGVVDVLTAARGVGPWTAQMFLIHQLRRPDVLPAGDLGIRQAVRVAFHHDELPSVDDVADFGTRWSPYRTYAAALLWASLQPSTTSTA